MATNAEMTALLQEAQEEIRALRDILEPLIKPPLQIGVAITLMTKNRVLVASAGGSQAVVELPKSMGIKIGTPVLLSNKGGIIEVLEDPIYGDTGVIDRVVGDSATVHVNGAMFGRTCHIMPGLKPEPGQEVRLDFSGVMIREVLGTPKPRGVNALREFVNVGWDEVGGMIEIKQFFESVFEAPLKHAALLEHYNVKPPSGVLLLGPPGCGKTLIAKAVATGLSKRFGNDKGCFISVKGPEILSPYVGMAEHRIADLFKESKSFFEEHNHPAVIFIDEAESILNKRGSGRSSDVDRTIVPAFLTEMDGMSKKTAIVILATNRPDMLDPAITREGRIDRKFNVRRPNAQEAKEIFLIHLKGAPLMEGLDCATAAEMAAEYLFDEKHMLYEIVKKSGNKEFFGLSDITSGALIANIVNVARRGALLRDINTKTRSGVTDIDLKQAVDDHLSDNRQLDFTEDVAKKVEAYRPEVDSIFKVS